MSRFITCPKCNRSIQLTKFNRHWIHTPNHASKENPRPPSYLFNGLRENDELDEGLNNEEDVIAPRQPELYGDQGGEDDWMEPEAEADYEDRRQGFPGAGMCADLSVY